MHSFSVTAKKDLDDLDHDLSDVCNVSHNVQIDHDLLDVARADQRGVT